MRDFEIRHYEIIDSTNTEARRLSQVEGGDRLVVVADRQTAGKGRRGRSWESDEGGNLYFSVLLRPDFSTEKAPMLTLVMAYSVAEVIREYLPSVQIKWPNDLVVDGKKLCGILTEMHLCESKIEDVIIGVGINVNCSRFSEGLSDAATSMSMQLGKQVEAGVLLAAVLEAFEKNYREFCQVQTLSFLQGAYHCLLANYEKQVRVLAPGQEYDGLALGINETGELLVQKEDGSVEHVYAGEVSVRGIYGYV